EVSARTADQARGAGSLERLLTASPNRDSGPGLDLLAMAWPASHLGGPGTEGRRLRPGRLHTARAEGQGPEISRGRRRPTGRRGAEYLVGVPQKTAAERPSADLLHVGRPGGQQSPSASDARPSSPEGRHRKASSSPRIAAYGGFGADS